MDFAPPGASLLISDYLPGTPAPISQATSRLSRLYLVSTRPLVSYTIMHERANTDFPWPYEHRRWSMGINSTLEFCEQRRFIIHLVGPNMPGPKGAAWHTGGEAEILTLIRALHICVSPGRRHIVAQALHLRSMAISRISKLGNPPGGCSRSTWCPVQVQHFAIPMNRRRL